VGLYGTLSYFVAMRRREIGVRLAMGARDREILSSFLRGWDSSGSHRIDSGAERSV